MKTDRKGPEAFLKVKIHPRSSRSAVRWSQEAIEVWVTDPPVDGKANQALLKILSRSLKLAPSRLSIVRGESGRTKTIHVDGLDEATCVSLLSDFNPS